MSSSDPDGDVDGTGVADTVAIVVLLGRVVGAAAGRGNTSMKTQVERDLARPDTVVRSAMKQA
jgi:hypothetical protein